MFRGHVITRIINGDLFNSDLRTTGYLIGMILMYIFNTYNNILSCIRFHYNMIHLHNFFTEINDYINYSIHKMEIFKNYIGDYKSYCMFNNKLNHMRNILDNYNNKIMKINPYSWSISQLLNLGYIHKQFYSIHNDEELHEAIMWSFGFNGYLDNIIGIQNNINKNKMNFCTFNKEINTKFTKAYFCNNDKPVKNTYNINKKFIITGPNASGKTTLLKTTLFNIILSQQIGCGYYSKGNINPYKYLHCYLNIPDTTGRDSLFQAEARRCKDIMEKTTSSKERHFCIFDELYSGTNPYEAEASSFSFITYLSKFNNVDFMMTTHLIKLCKNLKKNKDISNYNMITEKIDKYDFKYTYILKKGISQIKGAVKVLKELNYPQNIIDMTLDYLK